LIADGRISVTELASRAHASRATASARFDPQRDAAAVRGFTADADPAGLGYGLAVRTVMTVAQDAWPRAPTTPTAPPAAEWVALERRREHDEVRSARGVGRLHRQRASGAVGLQIDAGAELVAEQERHDVVTEYALVFLDEDLEHVVEGEQVRDAIAAPQHRVE